MLELACLLIIILLTIMTGTVLRKQYKKNTSVSCLPMSISMTASSLIGILITNWVSDMVLSTIAAISISLILIMVLTYSLPVQIIIESLSSALMGGMMGAMLGIMINQFMVICIVFFMALYLLSTVTTIVLWNKEEYPTFSTAIPKKLLVSLALSISLLGISAAVDQMKTSGTSNVESNMHHHH